MKRQWKTERKALRNQQQIKTQVACLYQGTWLNLLQNKDDRAARDFFEESIHLLSCESFFEHQLQIERVSSRCTAEKAKRKRRDVSQIRVSFYHRKANKRMIGEAKRRKSESETDVQSLSCCSEPTLERFGSSCQTPVSFLFCSLLFV